MAAERLKNSDRSIIEISLEHGYESQATFSRAFKDFFHVTPAQFRKNQMTIPFLSTNPLRLTELFHRKEGMTMQPEIIVKPAMTLIGIQGVTTQKNNVVPQLWQNFLSRMGEIESLDGRYENYGIG